MSGDSFIVSRYGLDGQREHMVPGNRKRGTPPRPKRGYASALEAHVAMKRNFPNRLGTVYRCGICGEWHIASPKRHGEPNTVSTESGVRDE